LPEKGETATQFTTERCRDLILHAVGEQIEVEILDIAPWQPYEQVADEFQCGRVFLTGDAAHTMPPFKAGGANTAIQSADNLAWKLAAVLTGAAGPGLLATYHVERHPVGRFNAHQSLSGPTADLLRLDDRAPRLPAGEEAPMFALLAGYRYRSAAVITDDPAPTDPDAVSLVDELRGQPGTRIPHAWVRRDGQRISTLDLCGSAFTLLTGADGTPWQAAAAGASEVLGIPINVCRIGADEDADEDVVDVDGGWSAVSGLTPDGALLVRPDDFIGWRADTMTKNPETQLRQALSAILAR
jgi:putative polyketide hydroxylase